MSAGDKPPKKRRGMPSEDRELWEFVAASVEPERGKSRVLDIEVQADQMAAWFEPVEITRQPQRGVGSKGEKARTNRAVDPTPSPAVPGGAKGKARLPAPEPQPVTLERRRARRIARGAEEIEARLDLHGMTQDDAHGALIGFIRGCHASGLRTVLVITGKGRSAASEDRDETDPWRRPRGVLKRNVPMWLQQSQLAGLVVSYSTAHVRHGGDGAIYVQIRVKR